LLGVNILGLEAVNPNRGGESIVSHSSAVDVADGSAVVYLFDCGLPQYSLSKKNPTKILYVLISSLIRRAHLFVTDISKY
jgi:hypothetical protein